MHGALEMGLRFGRASGAVEFVRELEVGAGILGEAGKESFRKGKSGGVFLRVLAGFEGKQVEIGFVWLEREGAFGGCGGVAVVAAFGVFDGEELKGDDDPVRE